MADLHWHDKVEEPTVVLYLDDDAARWLYDALDLHDPNDGATKELGKVLYG